MEAMSPDSIKYMPAFLKKGALLKESFKAFPALEPPPGLFPPPGLSSPPYDFEESLKSTRDEHDTTKDGNGAEFNNDTSTGVSSDGEEESFQKEFENAPGKVSRGSDGHLNGQCKPCAYFWSQADGCRRGNDCDFCHLCDSDALKKWRKAKKQHVQAAIAKARAKAARSRQACASRRQDTRCMEAVKFEMFAGGEQCAMQAAHLLACRPHPSILANAPASPWW